MLQSTGSQRAERDLATEKQQLNESRAYLVVNTSPDAEAARSIPDWGTKIPHALQPRKQNIK